MAAGDEVSLQTTLAVLERDGSATRGFIACEDLGWLFGKGIDTPTLSVRVSISEDDLDADPALLDDALCQLLFDGAAVGQPFLVTSDDLTMIGGDDEAAAEEVTATGRSALMITADWQITPDEGEWLLHSPALIFFGWQHPDYDADAGGWHDPDRVTRASLVSPTFHDGTIGHGEVTEAVWQEFLDDGWTPYADNADRIYPPYSSVDEDDITAGMTTAMVTAEWTLVSGRYERPSGGDPTGGDAKFDNPPHWEVQAADWIYRDADEGTLTLVRGLPFVVDEPRQYRLASTADEEHKAYLYGIGRGGVVIEESKQETGYTSSRRFDRVLMPGTYLPVFEFTIVDSEGGDGFDALSYYVGIVGRDDKLATVVQHSGEDGIKVWRQPKNDPRPGLTIGKVAHLVRDWNQLWMTDAAASCNVVTFSFTTTHDTNGDPFPDLHEKSWRPGTPFPQLMSDTGDVVDWDCHLDEDDGHLVIDCYIRKGTDKSADVPLVKGNADGDGNILTYRARRRPRTMTRLSGLTEDGYFVKVNDTLEETVTQRSSYIETEQSSSVGEGRRLANRMITEDGDRQSFEATFLAVEGAVPGIDFDWGDDVMALSRDFSADAKPVVTWGGSRSGEDDPVFTAELG